MVARATRITTKRMQPASKNSPRACLINPQPCGVFPEGRSMVWKKDDRGETTGTRCMMCTIMQQGRSESSWRERGRTLCVPPSPAEVSASQLHIRMPILYAVFVLTFQNSSAAKMLILSIRPFTKGPPNILAIGIRSPCAELNFIVENKSWSSCD